MAPITWSDVVAHVSTLSTVDPLQQTDLLALANTRVNVAVFDGEDGQTTRMARIYFAAHFAALPGAGGSAPAGPLIGQSRGGLSQQFQGVPQSSANEWLLTQWGRRYWQLLRGSRARWPRVP
jgi:hypothetical protein